MKNILFVGENPLLQTGNAHMMRGIIAQLDVKEYIPCVFSPFPSNYLEPEIFNKLPFRIIRANSDQSEWGQDRLLNVLQYSKLDILVMVGIDLWRYTQLFEALSKRKRNFKWVWIFPYDLHYVRKDWVEWINCIDYPCVYSQYGYNLLKPHVPNLSYFRPSLDMSNIFVPYPDQKKAEARKTAFPSVGDNGFIFGFVGSNLIRKDPQKLLKAFSIINTLYPDTFLYLHMNREGIFNIETYIKDCNIQKGSIFMKGDAQPYSPLQMVSMFNAIDCLVNCSMQEGLSWTILEAMLCGTPVIATDTTAQSEIIVDGGMSVPCKVPSLVPMVGKEGNTWIDSKCCSVEDMVHAMKMMVMNHEKCREDCIERGTKVVNEWIKNTHNINDVLCTIGAEKKEVLVVESREDAILFAQHSSAGDVLMTTQCFKGIKQRHPNKELIYMTQKQYWGIIEGNPYIDGLIDWDEKQLKKYLVVYNPHGEKILPGGWNNLDVKLVDMYPYFCKVEPDKMFIAKTKPRIDLPDEYIVVHTSGASMYRVYNHMDMVVKDFKLPVVQIGGKEDKACSDAVDLRGKLNWNETAYVMEHARAAIAVDSFPAHLAGALGTPVVVLFGPAPARVTGPIGDPNKIVYFEPNKLDVCPILSNCYGQQGKEVCSSPCINTLNPLKVRQLLTDLLEVK